MNKQSPGPVFPFLKAAWWKEPSRPAEPEWEWTMTHSFFAGMGGILVRTREGQYRLLDAAHEIKDHEDQLRSLTEEAIQDHSKAGALAKLLFCWQLVVFVVNCVARRTQRLPLSLLEVTTLAHALCGMATFAIYWHKPHSVTNAVVIVPKSDNVGWGRDDKVLRIGGIQWILGGTQHSISRAYSWALVVAVLYGLPHLLALSTEFPTMAERRCWEAATAIITGAPVAIAGWCTCADLMAWTQSNGGRKQFVKYVLYPFYIVYVIASCFILGESFRQLFALPSGAFEVPALICYLPHFS
ncbi:hypothetical protein AURDEDRAFT_107336 [Auricularia subglabra TFB-10046 SS5]|nr:hypothetical protein AURDEDRAFT_107336 [Auricularia subglabra TFB-10046 SS5]